MGKLKRVKGRRSYKVYLILLLASASILSALFVYVSQRSEWIPVINMTRIINSSDIDLHIDRKIKYTLVFNIIDIKSLNINRTMLSVGIAKDCNRLSNKSEFNFPVKGYDGVGEFKVELKPGYKLCYIVLEDGISIYPYSSFTVEGPGSVILTFNYPSIKAFIKLNFVIDRMYLTIEGDHDRKLKLMIEWMYSNVTATSIQYECVVPCNLTLKPPLFSTSVNVYIHR